MATILMKSSTIIKNNLEWWATKEIEELVTELLFKEICITKWAYKRMLVMLTITKSKQMLLTFLNKEAIDTEVLFKCNNSFKDLWVNRSKEITNTLPMTCLNLILDSMNLLTDFFNTKIQWSNTNYKSIKDRWKRI